MCFKDVGRRRKTISVVYLIPYFNHVFELLLRHVYPPKNLHHRKSVFIEIWSTWVQYMLSNFLNFINMPKEPVANRIRNTHLGKLQKQPLRFSIIKEKPNEVCAFINMPSWGLYLSYKHPLNWWICKENTLDLKGSFCNYSYTNFIPQGGQLQ